MSMNRIAGPEDIYVGGVFVFRNSGRLLEENKITHVLSVIRYSLDGAVPHSLRDKIVHLSIDIDDLEDQDMLIHFPKIVRFIERAVNRDAAFSVPFGEEDHASSRPILPLERDSSAPQKHADIDAITPVQEGESPQPPSIPLPPSQRGGAVLVHCAMGKSRSVTASIAYLLWKHPHRFGASDPTTVPRDAVVAALRWVRDARPGAEPNPGFMDQLAMWWAMGRPAHADDAVERHPSYRRWAYRREVEEAARVGRAPDRLRFEDEEMELELEHGRPGGSRSAATNGGGEGGLAVRCKKCRRVLATGQFVVQHRGVGSDGTDLNAAASKSCPHVFIEPLSWMRPVLEAGELDGRLVCPGARCGASIGRYAWQGFKCSCGEWVCPAFSLQRSKVDLVAVAVVPGADAVGVGAGVGYGGLNGPAARMAALGIRMPPGSLPGAGSLGVGGRKENL